MDEITKIRNDLAKMFRESVPEGRCDPVLDENGKDMLHPMYGKEQTDYQKEWASKNATGNTWRRGSTQSAESRKKMSESTIGMYDGKDNPNWKGGIAGKPGSAKRKAYMKKYNKQYHIDRKAA